MIDEILDKWYKKKWFKTRVEKYFYYQFPLEKIYWFELFLIFASTYLIIRGYFLIMALVYFFRLYLYAMNKYVEKLYPVHIQKYNLLLKRAVYNGAEIIIFASFMIQSYNLNEYSIFGIAVLAMAMYFFYQLFNLEANKKVLMQVRGDYLFIMAVGFVIYRIDYLMLFLIILYGFAMYDFLYKTINKIKDSPDFVRNKESVKHKLTQIQKKHSLKQKLNVKLKKNKIDNKNKSNNDKSKAKKRNNMDNNGKSSSKINKNKKNGQKSRKVSKK